MTAPVRFAYTSAAPALGPVSLRPILPLVLSSGSSTLAVDGLLDTGSSLCVLPYTAGLQLGLDWDRQKFPLTLSGSLAAQPARAVVLKATVASFPPVRLAFAWTQTDGIPVILGQTNFFIEFEVCFFRAQSAFEVKPK